MPYGNQYFSNLYDLVVCITKAIDLVNPKVTNHHQQVAYLSYNIADAMQLTIEQKRSLVIAALLHDVGAIALQDNLDFNEEEHIELNAHAFLGARLFEGSPILDKIANIIKYHHISWNYGEGKLYHGEIVPMLSHIIHFADRIAILPDRNVYILSQIKTIKEYAKSGMNTSFAPEIVEAFLKICEKEALWLDYVYQPMISMVPNDLSLESIKLTLDEVVGLTKIFSQIIDFRSPFTAMHSAGVAAVGLKLAELSGFSEDECKMMNIAANLHDIGKLAIPREILEKQGKLTAEEYDIIRSHSFYTYRLLKSVKGFETIAQWAAYHHEKLNGSGYPFHLKGNSLSLGARIMAVADIYAAISEDRPYRKGMPKDRAIAVLQGMANNEGISQEICNLLMDNYECIEKARGESAENSAYNYSKIL